MEQPPGHLANRMTLQCNHQGRVHIPIRSRGAGTYIIAVDRPISAPVIVRTYPNGAAAGRPYNFSPTGRPKSNWLVWHLDSNNPGGFNLYFSAGMPGTSVSCALFLAPPGTPRPMGQQWQPSDWHRH